MGSVLIALCAIGSPAAMGAPPDEKVPSPAVASPDATTAKEEKNELYIGLFMLGSNPSNRPLKFESDPYSNTNVEGGLGGGIKVGIYPAFARRIVGIEGELSGFNGKVDAPQATSGGVTRSGEFRLNVFNAMANLLFRYPGDTIQPYVGAGIGLSGGFARSINIQNSSVGTINENAGDAAFAYQLVGGGRVNVTDRLFVFSEYKYMVANYKWESEVPDGAAGPSFSLPFRTHIISGGVGLSF
jgi:opacity protein-like surface antigen